MKYIADRGTNMSTRESELASRKIYPKTNGTQMGREMAKTNQE